MQKAFSTDWVPRNLNIVISAQTSFALLTKFCQFFDHSRGHVLVFVVVLAVRILILAVLVFVLLGLVVVVGGGVPLVIVLFLVASRSIKTQK